MLLPLRCVRCRRRPVVVPATSMPVPGSAAGRSLVRVSIVPIVSWSRRWLNRRRAVCGDGLRSGEYAARRPIRSAHDRRPDGRVDTLLVETTAVGAARVVWVVRDARAANLALAAVSARDRGALSRRLARGRAAVIATHGARPEARTCSCTGDTAHTRLRLTRWLRLQWFVRRSSIALALARGGWSIRGSWLRCLACDAVRSRGWLSCIVRRWWRIAIARVLRWIVVAAVGRWTVAHLGRWHPVRCVAVWRHGLIAVRRCLLWRARWDLPLRWSWVWLGHLSARSRLWT